MRLPAAALAVLFLAGCGGGGISESEAAALQDRVDQLESDLVSTTTAPSTSTTTVDTSTTTVATTSEATTTAPAPTLDELIAIDLPFLVERVPDATERFGFLEAICDNFRDVANLGNGSGDAMNILINADIDGYSRRNLYDMGVAAAAYSCPEHQRFVDDFCCIQDVGGAVPSETADSVAAESATTEAASPSVTLPDTDVLASVAGVGDDVIDFSLPENQPGALIINHNGSSNFSVTSYGTTGRIDLLVNEIGSYVGVLPANFLESEAISELEITADGEWEIQAFPLASLPVMDGEFSDSGDFVLLHFEGPTRLTATHFGTSNFVVTAWGDPFLQELLINDIGPFSGTVRMDPRTQLLVIRADGEWTLSSE